MKKILNICQKDLAVMLRDRAALMLMFLAPIVLTLAMGAVTGAFSGRQVNTGISDVPVMIINQDQGPAGAGLVSALKSQGNLFKVQESADVAAARKAVEQDKVAAGVFIPADFTASMQAQPGGEVGEICGEITGVERRLQCRGTGFPGLAVHGRQPRQAANDEPAGRFCLQCSHALPSVIALL